MPLRLSLPAAVCCLWMVSANAQNVHNTLVEALEQGSILVCKAGQCVQTNHNMSREYLYNQLQALTEVNVGQNFEICEGNPATRHCIQKGILMPVSSPTIQTIAYISNARLVDARPVADVPGIDLIIDYKVKAGSTFPRCQTALSRIGTRHAGSSEMMSPRFNCTLTETGYTTFSLAYHIDYIDFDQGIIGAQYTIAADNILTGANAGYVLMDFHKGVKMDADEIFPYPEQLAALESGEVATFDTPAEIEAVWMKPTPFLNLLTPTFSPNNCYTFEGGCSARMLNNPTLAVPPAQARIDALTPPHVASTTGLIQQTVVVDPVKPAERRTVTTKTIVAENGKAVYSEEAIRHYVRETMDSPLKEDETKTQIRTEGEKPLPIEEVLQNAEKEYAAMKQFEAQTQRNEGPAKVLPTSGVPIQQNVPTDTRGQSTQQLPVQKSDPKPMPPRQAGQPITQTNIEILVPEGVALSEAERAYIEQIALPPEVRESQRQKQEVNVMVHPNGNKQPIQAETGKVEMLPVVRYPSNGSPEVSMDDKAIQSADMMEPSAVLQLTEPVMITADTDSVKEEQTSLWENIKKNVSNWFYF